MILYDHAMIRTNGVHLHVVQAGPEDGSLVILLHGFPEFWYGWRKQIDWLAEQGFRVWVPDQRGYNLSEKPRGIAAYDLDELSADLIGLIDAAGREKALVAGHDWGAGVAWWTANKSPERLEKLVILNAPHHAVFRRTLEQDFEQRRRSWYFLFFQLPWLPESLVGMQNGDSLARLLKESSRPGAFTNEELAEYRRAWAQPGALTAMINWYRAVIQVPPKRLPSPRITVPTLMLWGKRDMALRWEMAEKSMELCDDGRVVYFENATHWLQHEEVDAVNRHMTAFFKGEPIE